MPMHDLKKVVVTTNITGTWSLDPRRTLVVGNNSGQILILGANMTIRGLDIYKRRERKRWRWKREISSSPLARLPWLSLQLGTRTTLSIQSSWQGVAETCF